MQVVSLRELSIADLCLEICHRPRILSHVALDIFFLKAGARVIELSEHLRDWSFVLICHASIL